MVEKAYMKLAKLLPISDNSSPMNEKYTEFLLSQEGDINYQISANTALGVSRPELIGCTALHLAYRKRNLVLFNLLLNHGANIGIKNSRGSTVLHEIIEDICEKEAEHPRLQSVSSNPFVISALDALAKLEYPVNWCSENGLTHFHIACMANHEAAVELFSKKYPRTTVRSNSPMFPGYTELHFTARFSSVNATTILLKRNTIINAKDAKQMTPLHLLIKQNIEIAGLLNKKIVENAELLTAEKTINEEIICLLLAKCNRCVIDHTDLSVLHVACTVGKIQLTQKLLGNLDNINRAVNCESALFSGNTALHFAALFDVEKVKLLLQKGADIGVQNAKNQTAFDLCLERYSIKDIHDIIFSQPQWRKIGASKGTLLDLVWFMQNLDLSVYHTRTGYVDPFISNESALWPGYHLLHLAVLFSERDCKSDTMLIEKLTTEATSFEQPDQLGRTPVHLAFQLKKARVVNCLLGARTWTNNLADKDNLSLLHIACAAGATHVVQTLLSAGAAINDPVQASFEWYRHPQSMAKNRKIPRQVFIPKGATPLHIAVIVGHCKTMKLLVDKGADLYANDVHNLTPIHWLIVSDNPVLPAADILLSRSSRPVVGSTSKDNKHLATTSVLEECTANNGLTHLHVVCLAKNVNAVERLFKHGPLKVNEVLQRIDGFPGKARYVGCTPLHLALEGRRGEELVRLLVAHGADILMKNPIKNSIPLYEAFMDKQSFCADVFISEFKSDKALQRRVEEHSRLTMLHFYCCLLDVAAAEDLLRKDGILIVNKSTRFDSPIWPGSTPLQVLVESYDASSSQDANKLLKLLLGYRADVTMSNADGKTPLHLAYDLDVETGLQAEILRILLPFCNINRETTEGLSHFHIACAMNDVTMMEKLLKGNCNVNLPIDYFYDDDSETAGCTALHLAVFHPLNREVHAAIKLKAVTTLIRRGADTRVENSLGDTALHLAVKHYPQFVELFKVIVDAGGDVYAKNTLGQTPLEILLNSRDVTVESIKFFLDRGCRVNAFNPITQKGFLGMTFSDIIEAMLKACLPDETDRMGRTVVHNIVSISTPVVSAEDYKKLIERIVNLRCNIDQQDNLGRTALHVATQFRNHKGVFALLQVGADINIVDRNKKTAFSYVSETSSFCEGSRVDTEMVARIFSTYLQKMNVCLLQVHETNHCAFRDALKKYNVDVQLTQSFYEELNLMKNERFSARSSLTLLDVITHANELSVKTYFSRSNLDELDNFIANIDKNRFCESLGIIRLQYRKLSRLLRQ